MAAVEIRGIKKRFGRKDVLRDISFDAEKGEQIAIIGRNGSGKSTLLQILTGLLKPDDGKVTYFKTSVLGNRAAFSRYCGYLPQENPLLGELSVQDNISLWSGRLGRPDEKLISMFDLEDILKTPVNRLSGGMKRRVSIACCLVKWPPIVVMDEPTSALDYYFRKEIRRWMKEYREAGGILIVATHDDAEMNDSSRILKIENGIIS